PSPPLLASVSPPHFVPLPPSSPRPSLLSRVPAPPRAVSGARHRSSHPPGQSGLFWPLPPGNLWPGMRDQGPGVSVWCERAQLRGAESSPGDV
ncbi:vegetative cell wall protein gp1-like, partial [Daubentonia madagascariensis]